MKSFHSFRLDSANHCLWRGAERVQITPKAFDVLRFLVENAGRLVTQDELLEALWSEAYVNQEVLRKYILEIRKVLGDRPDKPEFIETVTKRGYRFIAPVIDDSSAVLTELPVVTGKNVGSEDGPPAQKRSHGKNVRRVAAVVVVVIITGGLIVGYSSIKRKTSRIAALKDASIAVLPFADMSPVKDQEYFSDGLTEALINDLAKVPGLKVVGRSSAFQFKGRSQDLREVGRKLGVGNILEGSVRREGKRLRISAELIKADSGFQLWSQTYDREINDVFGVQDEISGAVADALQSKLLSTSGSTVLESPRTTNSEAYEAYLQGQYFIARGQDRENVVKALSYADQATKLDPSYAPAWAQRSLVLETMARVAQIDMKYGFESARASAKKAIALDAKLATGYLALAYVQIEYDWDWQGASTSLENASLLAPGSAAVLSARGRLARNLGRVEEAVEMYKRAIILDPLRANFHLGLADEFYALGRYEEATAALEKAQQLNPQLSSLHLLCGQILILEGHLQDAVVEMEKETGDWEKLSGQALAYYAAGRRQDSDNALNKLIATHQKDSAYQIAQAYALRGEVEKAFEWLDRAYRQRDPGTPEFTADPLLKSLRRDPRYAELLRKMRLAA